MSHRIIMAGSLPLAAPWNGADKNLARLLVVRDHRSKFIIHTSSDEPWPDNRGHTYVRTDDVAAVPTTMQKLRSFAFLGRWVRSADLIHLISSLYRPSRLTGTLVRSAARLGSVPIIHTIPSFGDIPIERRNFPGDVSVVFSEHSREQLQRHGIPNVVRIHPPLDLEHASPRTDPMSLRQDLELGDRAVLCATHFGPDSGIEETVRAIGELPEEFADVVLVVACRTQPGQDRAAEERKVRQAAAGAGIEQRVRILGNVPDMPALIRACTITVLVPRRLASKMDLPLIVLESLAAGRPAIVTDQAPIRESLLDVGGVAVPFGHTESLARAIAHMLSRPDEAASIGERGQRAVFDHCDPAAVIGRYHDLYDDLLAS